MEQNKTDVDLLMAEISSVEQVPESQRDAANQERGIAEGYGNIPNGLTNDYYLYELDNIFENINLDLITYSPNSQKLLFVNLDSLQEFKGGLPNEATFSYKEKSSATTIDGEVAIQSESILYIEYNIDLNYNPNKLYIVSPIQFNEDTTDSQILEYGYIVNELVGSKNPTKNIFMNKTFQVSKIDHFTTRDGNQLILKIGKQIKNNVKINKVKLTAPRAFNPTSFKMLSVYNDEQIWTEIETENTLYPIWLNPFEIIDSSNELNLLNLWSTKSRILNYDQVKLFVEENNINVLLQLEDDDIVYETTVLGNNDKISWTEQGTQDEGRWTQIIPTAPWNWTEDFNSYTADVEYGPGTSYTYQGVSRPDGGLAHQSQRRIVSVGNIKLEHAQELFYSSLTRLLEDVLTATYNYNNNFKGAGYNDAAPNTRLNTMALYKQRFENKTIAEYIDGLEKVWESNYPDLLATDLGKEAYENYKKVRLALSSQIYGRNSVNNGLNNDGDFITPWFLDLKTKPVWNGLAGQEDGGSGIWTYVTWDFTGKYPNTDASLIAQPLKAKINSLYYDFEINDKDELILKPKIKKISDFEILQSKENFYTWKNMEKVIEESKFTGLQPSDFSLSDENAVKYIAFANSQILKMFASSNNLIKLTRTSYLKWLNENTDENWKNEFDLILDQESSNPSAFMIFGLWGSGLWDIEFLQTKINDDETKEDISILKLEKLNLFKVDNQTIGTMRLSL